MQSKQQEVRYDLLLFRLHYIYLGDYKLKRFDGVYTDRCHPYIEERSVKTAP